MEQVKFCTRVDRADKHGVAIEEGSILRTLPGDACPAAGVVTRIIREGDVATTMSCVGDVHIHIGGGSTRVTNRYSKWEHVPRAEQTYRQRWWAWRTRPYEHCEYDYHSGASEDEGFAIDGLLSLFPEDPRDYDNDMYGDCIDEVLGMIASHLDEVAAQKKLSRAARLAAETADHNRDRDE